jgi:hypothetical protein
MSQDTLVSYGRILQARCIRGNQPTGPLMIYLLTSDEDGTKESQNYADPVKDPETGPQKPNNPSHTSVKCSHTQTEYGYQR